MLLPPSEIEKLLQEGRDVTWEHTFEDFEIPSQRDIIVKSKGKKSIEAKILIVTDGVYSAVRRPFDI